MARRAFREHLAFFSEQCNVSEPLLQAFFNLYIALSSKLPLCPNKVEKYCKKIKSMYVTEIPWYPMNVTMHKILEHSGEFLRLLPPTITSGMLTEEASESSNKDIKGWQINHAVQINPTLRNLSVFNRLNDRSDPLVLEQMPNKKDMRHRAGSFPPEVLALCKDSNEVLALHYTV